MISLLRREKDYLMSYWDASIFCNKLKDSMNQIVKVVEKYNAMNEKRIIEALNTANTSFKKFYETVNTLSKIDYSALTVSISYSMEKIAELLKIYYERDSVKAVSEKNEPCVVDEIETIISEMPIDENAKDDIFSSKEFKELKAKVPWTRDQKLVLISILFGVIGFMISTIISLTNNSCETINNNVNINVNINNNCPNNESQIKKLENTTEKLEKILQLISEDIDESDDDSCSIHGDYEYSLIPESTLSEHQSNSDSSPLDNQSEELSPENITESTTTFPLYH